MNLYLVSHQSVSVHAVPSHLLWIIWEVPDSGGRWEDGPFWSQSVYRQPPEPAPGGLSLCAESRSLSVWDTEEHSGCAAAKGLSPFAHIQPWMSLPILSGWYDHTVVDFTTVPFYSSVECCPGWQEHCPAGPSQGRGVCIGGKDRQS